MLKSEVMALNLTHYGLIYFYFPQLWIKTWKVTLNLIKMVCKTKSVVAQMMVACDDEKVMGSIISDEIYVKYFMKYF